jgi:hypothetical protein
MQFKDGKYLKAKEKENIYRSFDRFIRSGFDPAKFTKSLYRHLSLHFGFIAHYNQNGFYQARFEDPQGRARTFQNIDQASHWTFVDENTSGNADLNKAIQDLVRKNKEAFMPKQHAGHLMLAGVEPKGFLKKVAQREALAEVDPIQKKEMASQAKFNVSVMLLLDFLERFLLKGEKIDATDLRFLKEHYEETKTDYTAHEAARNDWLKHILK